MVQLVVSHAVCVGALNLVSMEDYLTSLLHLVSQREVDDAIAQCACEHLDPIRDHANELLGLANQNIHVFPLSKVEPCWFRLYTDASLVKAVQHVQAHLRTRSSALVGSTDLDEAVRLVDMALIVAGGVGREDTCHELLMRLQNALNNNTNANVAAQLDSTSDHLPTEVVSIPRVSRPPSHMRTPSLDEFQQHMRRCKTPVVLEGVLDGWPALQDWKKLSYWYNHTLGGRRLVPVELGRSYVDEEWTQKIMPFREFMGQHILQHGSKQVSQTGYLAQHDLLKQIPALRSAIMTPDYCYLNAPPPDPDTPVAFSKANKHAEKTSHPSLIPQTTELGHDDEEDIHANVWFGPAWTISPLHYDPYHNILCQVVGRKYIRLYSPHLSTKLHPRSKNEPAPHITNDDPQQHTIDMSNTSSIDVAAMELSPHEDWNAIYPGVSNLPYFDCILDAGQALYIPVGWWHYVRSCSVGISVSFWW